MAAPPLAPADDDLDRPDWLPDVLAYLDRTGNLPPDFKAAVWPILWRPVTADPLPPVKNCLTSGNDPKTAQQPETGNALTSSYTSPGGSRKLDCKTAGQEGGTGDPPVKLEVRDPRIPADRLARIRAADPVEIKRSERRVWHEADQLAREDVRAKQVEDSWQDSGDDCLSGWNVETVTYLIDRLMAVGDIALVVAARKSGKTTLAVNLIAALADAEPFLGQYPAAADSGVIYLVNTEMQKPAMAAALKAMMIRHPERVYVKSIPGRAQEYDVTIPAVRAHHVARLRELGARVLIIDPIGPLMVAAGLDPSDNTDAARFLAAVAALKAEAGLAGVILTHHTGHLGDRARGASTLEGTPDVIWRLTPIRTGPTDQTDDLRLPKQFAARGRNGVELAPVPLDHDYITGRLTVSLKSVADVREQLRDDRETLTARRLYGAVVADPGHPRDHYRKLLGFDHRLVSAAAARLLESRHLRAERGPHNAQLLYPVPAAERQDGDLLAQIGE